MRLAIDTFLKKQYMNAKDFEIYNYSDTEIPAIMPHRHTFYEIYYVLSEHLDYVIGNRVYQMKKGDFILLPPGQLHYPAETNLKLGKKYSRIVLWCSTDYFDRFVQIEPALQEIWDIVKKTRTFYFSPAQGASQHLYDLLLCLLEESRRKKHASGGMVFAILLEIFVCLDRIICEKKYAETHLSSNHLFVNIIYYIHTHITENILLEDLSRHFWVSKGHISKFFREYVGLPVHQYILSLRLDGCRLAIAKGTPVMQAATLFGFQDYSSFFRAFKKVFAMSPKEYQESVLPSPTTTISETVRQI